MAGQTGSNGNKGGEQRKGCPDTGKAQTVQHQGLHLQR